MKIALALVAALTLSFAPCRAAGTLETFQLANQAYHARNYARALELYREVANRNPSSAVLYNLGNAAFKAGHLGEAVLSLEKARRLAPRDRDIRANLLFVRSQVKDALPEEDLDFLSRLIWAIPDRFSTNELAVGATLLFWSAILLIIGLIVNRSPDRVDRLRLGLTGTGVVFLIVAGFLGLKLYASDEQPLGIVLVPEIQANSGPGADEVKRFALHEGACVRILKESGGWLQIALPNGEAGWTPIAGVGRI